MSLDQKPKPAVSPASSPAGPLPDGGPPSGAAGTLHGRMLHVSRLATIGEMASGIAHELNQPLTAIANYAQACDRLLSRPGTDLGDVRRALQEIADQAVRAADILRRLRSLSRSQSMRRERTDLNAMIEEIRDLVLGDARVHDARAVFALAPGLPPVWIDAAQLQHAILNLVRNGLEASSILEPDAREITVGTALTVDGEAEIRVCDNGPGLSPQALERLFDPFFSTKAEGTGLGLAISNTVVRAHGGNLSHRPNVPRGACFYIRLPAESADYAIHGISP